MGFAPEIQDWFNIRKSMPFIILIYERTGREIRMAQLQWEVWKQFWLWEGAVGQGPAMS